MAAKSRSFVSDITVLGPDKKGVVAGVTNFIFENQGNIEKISQNVVSRLFGMHLEASFPEKTFNVQNFRRGLADLSEQLGMEIKLHIDDPLRDKNMAVLVTAEEHCLKTILEAKLKVNTKVVVGTDPRLKNLARRHGIPFVLIQEKEQARLEKKLIEVLEKYDVDFIVLARFMRILSPNFVWRYPNRILNIHPSLLPAFPGAFAYLQAYEKGAQVVGCTAHFVTEDLDQGPIIYQESFRVSGRDTLDSIKKKGQELEASTLLKALKLYLANKLEVYWGKVHLKP